MSDLIDDFAPGPDAGANAPEFTVTEISGAVKRTIEGEFSHVRVRGEIGRVSRPRSGHVYLDLKDDRSVLSGVIWKGQAARLATMPEEGLEVVATGRLTTFGGQSKYQIVIEDIAPAGVGALMAMLEKRKKALQAEGLFAAERKRPLPYLPEVIGVITSPSGAVIRDILHRLRDRFPRRVLIWPVAVQGAKCAPEVVRAIEGFNALTPGGALPRPDLLIVARGGGSIEDLWGFNEETVARAAAASQIPLISAVGHETDITLIDFVSDRRAPTPSAAAELAVPVRLELLAALSQTGARLSRCGGAAITQRQQRLRDLSRALPRLETLTYSARQRLDTVGDRLPAALRAAVQIKRVHLGTVAGPLRPGLLKRGLRGDAERLARLTAQLGPCHDRLLRERRARLEQAARGLRPATLAREVQQRRRALEALEGRFRTAAQGRTGQLRDRLDGLDRLRQTLGYTQTLARGFAVVRAGDAVVTDSKTAALAPRLDIQFHDGRLPVAPVPGGGATGGGDAFSDASDTVARAGSGSKKTAGKKARAGKPATTTGKAAGKSGEPPEQGSLF
ncbi:exodeoxyribonuclease VII large subunit [Brevirhabdus sp.]|uniref:exodeoxyribonuclease VII large subunit n=1 Tax=Brevirhabdus sp. TaxID=2004514 RepID=UPI0040584448